MNGLNSFFFLPFTTAQVYKILWPAWNVFLSDAPRPDTSAKVSKVPICCMCTKKFSAQSLHSQNPLRLRLNCRITGGPDLSKARKKVWLTSFHRVCWLLAWLRASMLASEESSRWPSAAGRSTRALRRGEEPRLHPLALILGSVPKGREVETEWNYWKVCDSHHKKRKKEEEEVRRQMSPSAAAAFKGGKTTKAAVGRREESVFLMWHINTARCCTCTGSECILGK